MVEQRRTADTRTRLDGASMNAIQVDDDKLERFELALDTLRTGLALMANQRTKPRSMRSVAIKNLPFHS